MKKLKILIEKNGVFYSPFKNYRYGELKDFIGNQMTCTDFDTSNEECSNGFYATDEEGLLYTNLSGNKKVFEVEVTGDYKVFNQFKQRFEKQSFLRVMPDDELRQRVSAASGVLSYNLYEALFPIDPRKIKVGKVTKKEIALLKEWASVGDSVRDSVRDSIRDSVWASIRASVWTSVGTSVGASVWDSVGDSVGDSIRDSVWASIRAFVWAFTSSLFPNIQQWKYINHEIGVNPFQACIDLWKSGLIPSYNDQTWRLHAGQDMKVVYELKK